MSTQGTLSGSGDREIQQRLKDWATWSRSGVGDPTITSVFVLGSTVGEPPICDDEGLRIDHAVCQLNSKYPQQAEIIIYSYLQRMEDYRIAKVVSMDRHTVGNLRRQGEQYIAGILDSTESLTLWPP